MTTRTRLRPPAPLRVVFDGQSMLTVPAPPDDVATLAMAGLGVPWHNAAEAGSGWYEHLADTAEHLAPQARLAHDDLLVLWGGQADILDDAPVGQQTGAATFQRLVDYATAAAGEGFDALLIVTCPAIGPDVLGTGRPTPTEAQALVDYNALIVSTFDPGSVVRCDTAPFDDATDTTYFAADRTHLTAAGAAVAAGRIRDAILATLAAYDGTDWP